MNCREGENRLKNINVIKFNIKISRWASFYFFVQNLSEWHFSNRKDYNLLWRKILGIFLKQEEDALKRFKEIRSQYPQSKSCFEKSFFLSEDPFGKLILALPAEEYQAVKNTFSLLESKFNSLYEKDLPPLNRWREILDKAINNQELNDTILVSLNTLYKTSIRGEEINIYLLFSAVDHTGGGANVDNQSISIEISRYPLEDTRHILGIVWHETIHLVFQNQYFYPLLTGYFQKDKQKTVLINEIVTASLFPRGTLGIRLLKNNPAVKLLPDVDVKQTTDILNLTKEYLDKNKYFDEDYIKKLSLITKKA